MVPINSRLANVRGAIIKGGYTALILYVVSDNITPPLIRLGANFPGISSPTLKSVRFRLTFTNSRSSSLNGSCMSPVKDIFML
jgi:hypothetical protein